MTDASIVEVEGPDALDEIVRFRVEGRAGEVTLHPSAERAGVWRDAHDAHARQWVVRDERGALCAAARLCVHHAVDDLPDGGAWRGALDDWPRPIASLNRLTVRRDWRGRGLARALDVVRLDAATAAGARTAVVTLLPPQRFTGRLPALEALGFRVVGEGRSADWPEMVLVARLLQRGRSD